MRNLSKMVFATALIGLALASSAQASGWTVWAPLGGQITSDPAACTAGNWTFVVARGTDNAMWYRIRSLSTGVWADWKRIPTTATSGGVRQLQFAGSPSISCYPSGDPNSPQVTVTAIATDGRLYAVYSNLMITTGQWYTWYYLSGTVQSGGAGPAQAATSFYYPGYQRHDFVRGTDGTVFWAVNQDGTKPWQRVLGGSYSDPAATMQSPYRMDLIFRASDGTLYHQFWENGVWYYANYAPVGGGPVTSSPDIVSRKLNSLDLFARGPGNDLLHKQWIDGVWGGWESLGGYLTSGPGATTYANSTRMMVFVRGGDGALWYKAWAP